MNRLSPLVLLLVAACVSVGGQAVSADPYNVIFEDGFERSTTAGNGVNFDGNDSDPGPWSNNTLASDGTDGQLHIDAARTGNAGFRLYPNDDNSRVAYISDPTVPIVNGDVFSFDVRFNDTFPPEDEDNTRNYAMLQAYYGNDTNKDAISLYRIGDDIAIRAEEDGSGSANYFGYTEVDLDVWYRVEITHDAKAGAVNLTVTNLDTDTQVSDIDWSGDIGLQTEFREVKFGLPFPNPTNTATGYVDFDNFSVAYVPEPSTMGLLVPVVAAVLSRRRK